MTDASIEALFLRYRETGDAQALGAVFDVLAPQLLLIAGHLRGAAAEDLVQATFLDAIRHGARWDVTRPLAPWFVGLLGNHLREARRQRRRVPDAQRIEPLREQRPDATAAANECLAAVHAAVERLPRHYRQVLSLRLAHGLDTQEIAHTLDLPIGTVKVRLHRGMGLLRRALPAGLASTLAVLLTPGRGLAAVRQVVLGPSGAAAGVASGTTVAVGILFGGMLMKHLMVGVVAVLVLAGVWWGLDAARGSAGLAAIEGENTVVANAAGTVEAPPADADREGSVAVPAIAPPASDERELVPTTGTLLVEAVWASDGEPAPGVDILAIAPDRKTRTTLRADARGKVEFARLAAGSYRLLPSRGRATKFVVADVLAGETCTCTVVVAGDLRLQVTVVDAAGVPQPGADVCCSPADGDRDAICIGRTDAVGRCQYRGLRVAAIWARKAGSQPSLTHDIDRVRPGEERSEAIDVRLQLGPAGCSLSGSVFDPAGRPVSAACVLVACDDAIGLGARRCELVLTTDAAGRFRSDEVPAGERYVVADAPGLAPTYVRVKTSAEQPVSTVIALRVGATLSGRVTDAEGQPAINVQVLVSRRQYLPGLYLPWGQSRSTRTDDDGRYRLEAILPDEMEATVSIEPRAVRQFTFRDGEQQTWDVAKEPDRSIRGVVVDADDKPLVHWMVRSMGRASIRNRNPPLAQTDAQGRFRLTGLEDDSYRLFVMAPVNGGEAAMGAAAMVPRAVVENVHPSADALTIRLDAAAMASGWIEGSIAMPEGVQAKTELSLYARALRGGGFAVPQERLAPGQTTFRIGPLPAGEYDLLCDVEGRGRLSQTGLRLGPDETLRLRPFAADAQRPLVVELRHADGSLATGATVKLRQTLDPCPETTPGHYTSRPIAAGNYDIIARGPDFALASFPVEFAGQEAPVVHTVAPATAVQLCMRPAVARDRWVGAMHVTLTDGQGAELIKEIIAIDGKQDFVVPIGLLPGSYTFGCSCFGDGHASVAFTVGSAPQRVELQLVK